MKPVAIIFFLFSTLLAGAQGFGINDWKIQSVEADAAKPLAKKLSANCKSELEKVTTIFKWITGNITYQVKPRNSKPGKSASKYEVEDPSDTAVLLKPLDERVADLVIRRKEAFCDGYARLFKTLCDFSGIRAEIITGYSRTGMDKNGQKFKSNHTWNAVCIDSTWHLLDVTWASGFTTFSSNEFIRRYDEYYFLTPPKQFIADHYPEDLQWTLLPEPPSLKEFYTAPFKQQGFVRSKITAYKPEKGIINAILGDTILLEVETNYLDEEPAALAGQSSAVSYWDTAAQSPLWAWTYLKPTSTSKGKINYTYAVQSGTIEYLNLVLHDHVLMRYKLNIVRPATASIK